jgi:16S rRNA (cytidine1402-2'-O)-methyltransferase
VKEITKIHEEALRGNLSDVIRMLAETTIAGEYVILVEGRRSEGETLSFEEALEEVRALMKKGKGRKEAVRTVAEQYGMSKNELYERSLG